MITSCCSMGWSSTTRSTHGAGPARERSIPGHRIWRPNRRQALNHSESGENMIRKMRLLVAVALTIVVTMPAIAEENFGLLKAKQIRARVVGKDISDGVHWSEYYRKDGALISMDMGTQRTGIWKIQGDKLCKSKAKT